MSQSSRFRLLAALPLTAALAVGVVAALIHDPVLRGSFLRWSVHLSELAAAIGCWQAARVFEKGDHLRNAWLFNSISSGIMFVAALLLGHLPRALLGTVPPAAEKVRLLATVLVNVMGVVAMWVLARAWCRTGLEQRFRWVGYLVSGSIALLIGGFTVWSDLQNTLHGHAEGIYSLVSDLGDVMTFALLGSVLMTAIALRGGILVWTWGLMALSAIAWLLFDVTGPLSRGLHFDAGVEGIIEESMVVMACTAWCAAGLAQRWALMLGRIRRESVNPQP